MNFIYKVHIQQKIKLTKIIFIVIVLRLREERVDDRNPINEQKSREHTSHNGEFSFKHSKQIKKSNAIKTLIHFES